MIAPNQRPTGHRVDCHLILKSFYATVVRASLHLHLQRRCKCACQLAIDKECLPHSSALSARR
jgi:hypothetical protein